MRAVNDRLIIEIEELESSTASGIIIPETAKRRDFIGIVQSVGPDAKRMKLEGIKSGDRVLYNQYSEMLKHEGVEYRVCKDENVLVKLPTGKAHATRRTASAETSKEWTNLD